MSIHVILASLLSMQPGYLNKIGGELVNRH